LGTTDFLDVLDAARQEYMLEEQQVNAQLTVVLAYIVLYKTLGCGWELYQSFRQSRHQSLSSPPRSAGHRARAPY
jgi:outer membrane protein TolC